MPVRLIGQGHLMSFKRSDEIKTNCFCTDDD